jgi:hypothetical protein
MSASLGSCFSSRWAPKQAPALNPGLDELGDIEAALDEQDLPVNLHSGGHRSRLCWCVAGSRSSSVTTPPPDSLAKTLVSALALLMDKGGWLISAAAAAWFVGYAPVPDLADFQGDWGYWILPVAILLSALALVKPLEWMWGSIRRAWRNRLARRTMETRKIDGLRQLHALPPYEKSLLMGFCRQGQNTFRRPLGFEEREAADRLVSKGLLEYNFMESFYTIPPAVWEELQTIRRVAGF